jgi:serine/threonine-protein kinase RsbW
MASGCDDFDTKPVELTRLLTKIDTLLTERVLALSPLSLNRLAEIREFLSQSLTDLGCASSVDAFVLAVDEICANLVQHADVGDYPGPTRVTVRRSGPDAIITVEDRGRPFDPANAPPPDLTSSWEDRPVGGLGWFLVRQMVDDLTYVSTNVSDGVLNRLTLIKRNVANGGGTASS